MKSLDWDEEGLLVNRKFLSNFPFADDIVILAKDTSEAETMLNKLGETEKA